MLRPQYSSPLRRVIRNFFGPLAPLYRIFRSAYVRLKLVRVSADLDASLAPVFVIGANRSGTSLLAKLLSQSPEFEGLFSGTQAAEIGESGHVNGYSESAFVWSELNDQAFGRLSRPGLFGSPHSVSAVYREGTKSTIEEKMLRKAVLAARRTDRIPLIKDNANTLRIGLITKIFPKARFVLVLREPLDYLRSNRHKFAAQLSVQRRLPEVGLHWLLINTVALYDLERFAPDRYVVVNLSDLFVRDASSVLEQVLIKLGASAFRPDVSEVDECLRFNENPQSQIPDVSDLGFRIDDVQRLVRAEKQEILRIQREFESNRFSET